MCGTSCGKNVSKYNLEKECCGCSACYSICPANAIKMVQNERGFFNPQVSENCVRCGQCIKVCQIEKENYFEKSKEQYAAKNRNDKIRMTSSSGGVFSVICEALYAKYGEDVTFYGAAWDNGLHVIHKGVTGTHIYEFRGSKYVQSDLKEVFREIKNLLQQKKTVVFSGTGCQCFGLRNYLKVAGGDDSQLFVIDIVCHGVPAPKMWSDYLETLGTDEKKHPVSYIFRNKKEGWRGMHPLAFNSKGEELERNALFMSYCRLFGNLMLNEICYSCKFACEKRVGDITLGDFWGIEKTFAHLDDNKGVSICLINTEKARAVFEEIKPAIEWEAVLDDSYLQPQLCHPTRRNYKYNRFWKDYKKKDYLYVAKKYTEHSALYVFLYNNVYKRIRKM